MQENLLDVQNIQYYPDDILEEKEYAIDPDELSGIQRDRYTEIKHHVGVQFHNFRVNALNFLQLRPDLPQNALNDIPFDHLENAVIFKLYHQGVLWNYPSIQKGIQRLLNVSGKLSIPILMLLNIAYLVFDNSESDPHVQNLIKLMNFVAIPNILQITPKEQSTDIVFGKNHREFKLDIPDAQMEFFLDKILPHKLMNFTLPMKSKKTANQVHKIIMYATFVPAWLIKARYSSFSLIYYIPALSSLSTYVTVPPGVVFFYLQCYESIEKTLMDSFTRNPISKIQKLNRVLAGHLFIDYFFNVMVQYLIFELFLGYVQTQMTISPVVSNLARFGEAYNILCTRNTAIRDALSPYEFQDPFGFQVTHTRVVDEIQIIQPTDQLSFLWKEKYPILISLLKGLPVGLTLFFISLNNIPDLAIWVGLGALTYYGRSCYSATKSIQEAKEKRQILDTRLNGPLNTNNSVVNIVAVTASLSNKTLNVISFFKTADFFLKNMFLKNMNLPFIIARNTQYALACVFAIPAMYNEYQFQTPRVISALGKLAKKLNFWSSSEGVNNNQQNNMPGPAPQ